MHCFGSNDLTQFGGNLEISSLYRVFVTQEKNFLNLYNITKGKLLRYSIAFSFAYVVSSCITGDIFCQLCNDNIFWTIK